MNRKPSRITAWHARRRGGAAMTIFIFLMVETPRLQASHSGRLGFKLPGSCHQPNGAPQLAARLVRVGSRLQSTHILSGSGRPIVCLCSGQTSPTPRLAAEGR